MPAIPPEGPPFYTSIKINITNTGTANVSNLGASRATIYYNDTIEPLVTLDLTSVIEYFNPVEVGPGESIIMEFTNDRSKVYSPTIQEGTMLFARMIFVWDTDHELILTTPHSSLLYTY
jgi:hypothetical protein